MLLISVGTSLLSCLGGVYLSYHLDVSTGGSIVVLMSALFTLAMVFAPKYGMIAQQRQKRLNMDDSTPG